MDTMESRCELPKAVHQHLQPITVLLPAKKGLAKASHVFGKWLPYAAAAAYVGLFCFLGPWDWEISISPPYTEGLLILLAVLIVVSGVLCWGELRYKQCRSQRIICLLSEALQADPGSPLRELVKPGARLDRLLAEANTEDDMIQVLQPAMFLRDAVCLSTCSRQPPDHLEPLTVPFEPMPLTTASVDVLPSTAASGKTHSRRLGTDPSAWARVSRRILHAPYGGWVILASSFVLLGLISFLSTGHGACGTLLTIPIFCLYVISRFRSILATERMYVIPGGLIDTWKKYMYRRSKGLMIWCPDSNTLHVRSLEADRDLVLVVTPSEAIAAIRAWLSPAPEPSDEVIKSFLKQRR